MENLEKNTQKIKEEGNNFIDKAVKVIGKSIEKSIDAFTSPVQMSKPQQNIPEKEISLGEQAINSTKISERKRESEMERSRQEAVDSSNKNKKDGVREHQVL